MDWRRGSCKLGSGQDLGRKKGAIMNPEQAYQSVNQRGDLECKYNVINNLLRYTSEVVNQEGGFGAAMNRARLP